MQRLTDSAVPRAAVVAVAAGVGMGYGTPDFTGLSTVIVGVLLILLRPTPPPDSAAAAAAAGLSVQSGAAAAATTGADSKPAVSMAVDGVL